jgi:hypothetical protein
MPDDTIQMQNNKIKRKQNTWTNNIISEINTTDFGQDGKRIIKTTVYLFNTLFRSFFLTK